MKIKVYFFGKKTEIEAREKKYIQRVNFNHELEVISLSQSGSKDIGVVKSQEAESFLKKIESTDFLIALDERGVQMDSLEFSDFLMSRQLASQRLVFVVGGAHGLHDSITQRADFLLSFGRMVWTREVARLMLLEQLYRGFEIARGSNFHKV